MPLFEYECQKRGYRFEVLILMSLIKKQSHMI